MHNIPALPLVSHYQFYNTAVPMSIKQNKTQSFVANVEILVAIWQIYFFFFDTMVVQPSASTVLPRGCCSGSSTSMSLELCSTGCRTKLFEFVDGPTFSLSSSSNSSCSFPTLKKKKLEKNCELRSQFNEDGKFNKMPVMPRRKSNSRKTIGSVLKLKLDILFKKLSCPTKVLKVQ